MPNIPLHSGLRFGSVCSGIEAASEAWKPLGMEPVFLAEIEPFCCELLQQRHPGVPNLGSITEPDFTDRAAACGHINILVGGTPCQAFSVAGLRRGLDDDRGNLTLRFVEIANAIRPVYTVWENVPGVLSDSTNAFGCLLGGLAGSDSALVPGRGQRWTDAGLVIGPRRRVAWRILDAQFTGLAQRRERVFVVASAGEGAHPLEILSQREGVQRHYQPRREAGQGAAGTLSARTQGGGGLGTDFEIGGGSYQLAPSLTASGRGTERTGESRRQDCVIPVPLCPEISGAVSSKWAKGTGGPAGDECYNLIGQGPVLPILEAGARTGKSTTDSGDDLALTLRAMEGGGGNHPAVAFKASHFTRGKDGAPSETTPPLSADADKGDQDTLVLDGKGGAGSDWAVRRLTPL